MNLSTPAACPNPAPVRLTNHQLAARLRHIGRERAGRDDGYHKVRAFFRAAHVVARLPDSLEREIRAGIDAARHPCIGPKIARELRLMVKGEDFGQLEFPLIYGRASSDSAAA